jgi:flavodoxin I
MPGIGIFYGSTMGNTEAAAELIGKAFGSATVAVKSISNISLQDLPGYDLIVLGSSTWGYGDLQDEWEAALPGFDQIDLSGKKVALFGLGDQEGYSDTFVDAIGIIAEKIRERGGEIVGAVQTEGYSFDASKAVEEGTFIGLPLDEDNQGEITSERITSWVQELKKIVS